MKHAAANSNSTASLDARILRMISDPDGYFREARERARKESEEAVRRERELRKRKKS